MLGVSDWPAMHVTSRNSGCLAFLIDGLLRHTHVLRVGFLKAGLWCTKQGLRLQVRSEHRSRKDTNSCFQANQPQSNSNPQGKLESTSTVMSHFKISRSNMWSKGSTEPNNIMKASRTGVRVLCKPGLCVTGRSPACFPLDLLTNDYLSWTQEQVHISPTQLIYLHFKILL